MDMTAVATEQLVAELKALVRAEERIDHDALIRLFELERRGVMADEGYDGVASYCIEFLGMKEKAARCRAKAVGMMKRWPKVKAYVENEAITMTTMLALDDVLTDENCAELLDDVEGMSEQAVGHYLMVNFDRPTRKVGFSVGCEWQEKFDELADLAADTVGTAMADVLEYAMEIAIEHLIKRRCGSDRPRSSTPRFPAVRRYIPVAIRRAVWERDGGCCTFVGADGHRCCSRRRLQFHHVVPYERGGPTAVENLTLHCRTHNLRAAVRDFGEPHMQRSVTKRSPGGARMLS